MAYGFSNLKEERDTQTHMDVLVIGAAGGVLGGAGLSYLRTNPTWTEMAIASVLGVALFDYFLCQK
jgi:uncharacterized membrane protein (DUF441 family)